MQRDSYSRKAKEDGMRARSVYKLIQINNRFHILRHYYSVLDLGCWPGSWLQLLSKKVDYVLGVDIKAVAPIPKVETIKADITDEFIVQKIKEKHYPFDLVVSDIAPSTTGNKDLDQGRQADLARASLDIALEVLAENGGVLVKIFQSNESHEIFAEYKKYFRFTKQIKPEASRKTSKEMYFLFQGLRTTKSKQILTT